jgi:hypothetical protein
LIRPAANSTASFGSANHRAISGNFTVWALRHLCPEGCQGDRGINGPASSARFMPRKPLDALEGTDAPGSCRGWGLRPRRLPHGECGVRGSAPEGDRGTRIIISNHVRNMPNYPRILLTNQFIEHNVPFIKDHFASLLLDIFGVVTGIYDSA